MEANIALIVPTLIVLIVVWWSEIKKEKK